MREILFRGKRIDNGEWVEGWMYKRVVHLEGCHQNVVVDAIEVYDGKSQTSIAYYTVDPETVGQYTGLICNGKKIFEGDICRVCLDPEICVGVVEYDERTASFILKVGETEMVTFLDYMIAKHQVGDRVWIERIGNIHDNPELIGGADNG